MMKNRILHRVLMVIVISLISWVLYYVVWFLLDEEIRADFSKGWPFRPIELLVDYATFCIFSFMATFYYLRSYDKAERERDRYKLMALENQINPHFVFNNFSTLADLIEVNPKKASEYLMNLSKVYRYTLTHLESDTVTVQDEIGYLQRYLMLLKERFGDTITVKIAPEISNGNGFLPPAVLQMIVENAIKHNEHTISHPLTIEISGGDEQITVCNNKRMVSATDSAHVGNHNIEERYRLLTNKKVLIDSTDDFYSITIPIISQKALKK